MSFGIVAGAAIAGGAALGAGALQAGAASSAAKGQQNEANTVRSDLGTYRDLGQGFINPLVTALGYNMNGLGNVTGIDSSNPLQQKFSYGDFTAPTAAEAQATPGYQFTLDNGLKAEQNSASARGLGVSGAALKGASTFASGLADSTYNDTYNRDLSTYSTNRSNALGNYTTNYSTAADNANRLLGLVGNGQNAAAQTGALGTQSANSIAGTQTSGAAASAAGIVGGANAINNGISTSINNTNSQNLLNTLMSNQPTTMYGGGAYGASNGSNPSGYNVGSNQYGFQG